MTWKEFKEFVESKGVKDNYRINYIDINGYDEVRNVVIECYGGKIVEDGIENYYEFWVD